MRLLLVSLLALALGCAQGTDPDRDAGGPDASLIDRCPEGQTECGARCVSTSNDPDHCSGCFLECNEGDLCSESRCAASCLPPTTQCGDRCYDTATDEANCGGCGIACEGGKQCVNGACESECADPTSPCDDGCFDLFRDPTHCGTCDIACPMGATCASGECRCPSGTIDCGRQCVDPESSVLYCGASGDCSGPNAGVACAAGGVCAFGECGSTCPTGLIRCGEGTATRCANLATDPVHCGACDNTCTSAPNGAPACVDRACTLSCMGRYLDCDGIHSTGCETDPLEDDDHCGACDNACGAGMGCSAGRCAPAEDCDNGVDDDEDGFGDCADLECEAATACVPVLCSGNVSLTAPSGAITDGSGSGSYASSMSCSWSIDVPGATGITLDFSSFHLETCCDWVTVYEGSSTAGRQLGRFSGSTLPPSLLAYGSRMYVTFTTDGSVTYPGFTAAYNARTAPLERCTDGGDDDGDGAIDCADSDCASDEACGPARCTLGHERTAPTGTIQDGSGSGSSYWDNMSCSWRIQVPGSAAIQLDFREFATESGYDIVTIYEGTDATGDVLGTFSGSALPPRVYAIGDAMFVTFTSDGGGTRAGWVADYVALSTAPEVCNDGTDEDGDSAIDCADSDCATSPSCGMVPCRGDALRTTATGRIEDGSGAANYENNQTCTWTITVPGARNIDLTFESFALESCCDFVRIYQGTDTSRELEVFSGTTLPGRVSARGDSMYIVFDTDGSVTADGFAATYTSR